MSATYVVMEPLGDELVDLFASWHAEIDSIPFAHEAECDKIVRALLGDHCHQRCIRQASRVVRVVSVLNDPSHLIDVIATSSWRIGHTEASAWVKSDRRRLPAEEVARLLSRRRWGSCRAVHALQQ